MGRDIYSGITLIVSKNANKLLKRFACSVIILSSTRSVSSIGTGYAILDTTIPVCMKGRRPACPNISSLYLLN